MQAEHFPSRRNGFVRTAKRLPLDVEVTSPRLNKQDRVGIYRNFSTNLICRLD